MLTHSPVGGLFDASSSSANTVPEQGKPLADGRLTEQMFYHRPMSQAAEDVFQLEVECACGWRGRIVGYRTHLLREHCNVNGCGASATALVSFGYRDPGFTRVGTSLGVCPRHRQHLREGRMHMIVEELPTASRR